MSLQWQAGSAAMINIDLYITGQCESMMLFLMTYSSASQ